MKQTKEYMDSKAHQERHQILDEAEDFFSQYFESKKQLNSPAHLERLHQIKEEIGVNGSYSHRYDELVFGSKLAWRNAARCIGRIQWNKLQIFDARHCETAKELFDFICNHIKYATNGGNLR